MPGHKGSHSGHGGTAITAASADDEVRVRRRDSAMDVGHQLKRVPLKIQLITILLP